MAHLLNLGVVSLSKTPLGYYFFVPFCPRVVAARQPWAILLQALRAIRGIVIHYTVRFQKAD
jgi:hypothetical protein